MILILNLIQIQAISDKNLDLQPPTIHFNFLLLTCICQQVGRLIGIGFVESVDTHPSGPSLLRDVAKKDLFRLGLSVEVLPPCSSNTESLRAKYTTSGSAATKKKRASGTNALVNQCVDSSFFGSITVGNPPVPYNGRVVPPVETHLPSPSPPPPPTLAANSVLAATNPPKATPPPPPFSITYGSGAASGTLVSDTVAMAGFSVVDQVFAVCDDVSDGLLTDPVSGLMGLAWQSMLSSGASPFWQTLAGAKDAVWDELLMAFQLTRFNQDPKVRQQEVGGSFTLGE
ncbi:hypothetical protein D9758_008919 [Tetrapyrgos nigripes]|uniref:Peptidase A1 domain-containing protein n=1 Tax=Tetrapyrgos nigripes TaxID=182062 RepID=A0A8H5GKB7_9AGAR|nr:hypothetical protein D9758_008919 [Tetrapyrgos nigripes]